MAPVLKEFMDERRRQIRKQAMKISCDRCSDEESHRGCGNPVEGSDAAWRVRKGVLQLLTYTLHIVR